MSVSGIMNGLLSRFDLRIRKVHNASQIMMILDYLMNPTLTKEPLIRVGPQGDGGSFRQISIRYTGSFLRA
jgi:hypothetical protein